MGKLDTMADASRNRFAALADERGAPEMRRDREQRSERRAKAKDTRPPDSDSDLSTAASSTMPRTSVAGRAKEEKKEKKEKKENKEKSERKLQRGDQERTAEQAEAADEKENRHKKAEYQHETGEG